VGVADHELHSLEPPGDEASEELLPKRLVFREAHIEAQPFPPPVSRTPVATTKVLDTTCRRLRYRHKPLEMRRRYLGMGPGVGAMGRQSHQKVRIARSRRNPTRKAGENVQACITCLNALVYDQ